MTDRRLLPLMLAAIGLMGTLSTAAIAAEHDKSPKMLRVAGIVLKWIRADKEANYRRIEPLIREAAQHGAQLIVTSECFLDGYSAEDRTISEENYRALGEPIPG